MELVDRFPLPVLKGMRRAIALAHADQDGLIWETIPRAKRGADPFRISTNKAETLGMIDAALNRRGVAAEEAMK